jgi:BirA family biotin operon repressor/biotin-[acetyl-CoA-carboxylase] ligase
MSHQTTNLRHDPGTRVCHSERARNPVASMLPQITSTTTANDGTMKNGSVLSPPGVPGMNAPVLIGRPLIRVESTASTMDLMTALADRGAKPGTAVVAGYQSAGRGRAGRSWQAEPWTSILMSFLHVSQRSPADLGQLAPAIGLAVANTAGHWLPSPAAVKWPNDVLSGDRKLAGILVTTRALPRNTGTRVIVGIGLNVCNDLESLPRTATSLSAAGRPVALDDVLPVLLSNLTATLTRVEAIDDRRIVADINDRLAWRNQPVTVANGDRIHTGILDGIDLDGALRLLTTGGDTRIVAGDLTRGPRPSG